MNVRPLQDRVIVKRWEPAESTEGGIIIPETGKEKPMEADVIAVGPGKVDEEGKRIELEVRKGDHILISRWAGNEIKFDGEEHLILREDEILAIIDEPGHVTL
jgi:chaperonin GroES